jgi:hypothetical protein
MEIEEQRTKLANVWHAAAELLSIRIEAPYTLKNIDGNEVPCVAYLPDFGGPNGMVIGHTSSPRHQVDASLKSAAESRHLFYSFINFKVYEIYNEEAFKEALMDWAFFGVETLRPSWMADWKKTKA